MSITGRLDELSHPKRIFVGGFVLGGIGVAVAAVVAAAGIADTSGNASAVGSESPAFGQTYNEEADGAGRILIDPAAAGADATTTAELAAPRVPVDADAEKGSGFDREALIGRSLDREVRYGPGTGPTAHELGWIWDEGLAMELSASVFERAGSVSGDPQVSYGNGTLTAEQRAFIEHEEYLMGALGFGDEVAPPLPGSTLR